MLACRELLHPACFCDGNGLYIQVHPTGARSWVQRLMIQGRRRELGLGGFPLVSLAEARAKAFAYRKVARDGGDPLTEKRRADGIPTFADAAERVWKGKNPGWRHPGHAQEWMSSLEAARTPAHRTPAGVRCQQRRRTRHATAHLARPARDGAARAPAYQRGRGECRRAAEILEAARTLGDGRSPFVFASQGGKPFSITRLPRLLQNLKIAAVPHGFRSTFRDWAAEETNHPTRGRRGAARAPRCRTRSKRPTRGRTCSSVGAA